MQQGRLIDVMDHAASNANGAAAGFMGLGFMNMQTGGAVGNAVQGVAQDAFAQDDLANSRVNENTIMPKKPAEQAPVQPEQPAQPAEEPATEDASSTENVEESKANGPKFCPECGTKLAPGTKFCPECGKKL